MLLENCKKIINLVQTNGLGSGNVLYYLLNDEGRYLDACRERCRIDGSRMHSSTVCFAWVYYRYGDEFDCNHILLNVTRKTNLVKEAKPHMDFLLQMHAHLFEYVDEDWILIRNYRKIPGNTLGRFLLAFRNVVEYSDYKVFNSMVKEGFPEELAVQMACAFSIHDLNVSGKSVQGLDFHSVSHCAMPHPIGGMDFKKFINAFKEGYLFLNSETVSSEGYRWNLSVVDKKNLGDKNFNPESFKAHDYFFGEHKEYAEWGTKLRYYPLETAIKTLKERFV